MTGETAPQATPQSRRIRGLFLILLWIFLGLIFTLSTASLVLLRTHTGHKLLESGINRLLHSEEGLRVHIQGLHGALPFAIGISGLRLSDPEGTFFEGKDLRLVLSPADLLSGRIHITEIHSRYLGLYRLPGLPPGKAPAEKPGKEKAFPPNLPAILLDQLLLEEVYLADTVAGEDIRFRVEAFLGADDTTWQAGLHARVFEGPPGTLQLDAGYFPATRLLNMNLQLEESSGALALMLGLAEKMPLSASLGGEALSGAWSGDLHVQAGDRNKIQTSIHLSWEDLPTLLLDGRWELDENLLPAPLAGHMASGHFATALSREQSGDIFISDLALGNKALDIRAKGHLHPTKQEMDTDLSVHLRDTETIARWIHVNPGSEVTLHANVSGSFTSPHTRLELQLTNPDVVGISFSDLSLKGELSLRENKKGLPDLVASGRITGKDFLYVYAPLPDRLEADFDLHYALSSGDLLVNDLSITGEGLAFQGHGSMNTKNLRNNFSARLNLNQLTPWIAPYGMADLGAAGTLTTHMQGVFYPLDLHFDIETSLTEMTGLPAPLDILAGERANLTGELELGYRHTEGSELGIHIRGARLTTALAELSGHMNLFPMSRHMESRGDMLLHETADLLPDKGVSGALNLGATLQGRLDELSLSATLTSTTLTLPTSPMPFSLDLAITDIPRRPTGNLTLSGGPEKLPFSADIAFFRDNGELMLNEITFRLPGADVAGNAGIHLSTMDVLADIKAHISDAAPLASLAGLNAAGTATLDLRLLSHQGQQDATLLLSMNHWKTDVASLGHLLFEGTAHDLTGQATLDATLLADNLASGTSLLEHTRASARGSLKDLSLFFESQGKQNDLPFYLDFEALYNEEKQKRSFTLHSLYAQLDGHTLSALSPIELHQKGDTFTLRSLNLALDKGELQAKGIWSPERIELTSQLQKLPISLLLPAAKGTVDARMSLSGSPSNPEGHVSLTASQLSTRTSHEQALPEMEVKTDATFHHQVFSIAIHAREMHGNKPILTGKGSLPVKLSLAPFRFLLPQDTPVQAAIRGELDLARLGFLFMPDHQLLEGKALLNLQIEGPLHAPRPSGTLTLEDGVYQHLEQGLLIRDMAASVSMTGGAIRLDSFTASDGFRGLAQGTGEISLSSNNNFPFQLSLNTERFRVVDNPSLMAAIAQGSLNIQGTHLQQEVTGDIRFERVEIFLKEFGGPDIAELTVVEIHGPGEEDEPPPRTRPPMDTRLNLQLHFPSRIFVRGRGLDSEWGGNLDITGQAKDPVVRGDIRLIRGRLDFLGKRLTLSQGTIMLDGSQPPSPFVSFEARQEGREVVSILRVEGQPPQLDFTLSSEPALPQDEVLAQMLFGRSLATITPIQAAQLALAARELAGYGGGPGAMDTARSFFGLDDLNIVSDGDDNDDIRLRAGKYVHEKVYLRVEKDLRTNDDLVSADVELSRRITLESKIGPKGGGMGLFWKKDY
ncbi:translocation/assembly module TamB domain-containing protein [Desulfobotulus sp. H1]|uniref:Translocation/assembly module TamB domain-containing protein n=1 Tax=Desulfobotulus pelophilus TaxID=2823377 RepID=A0ABT3ND70_9BACT|nr:translocation/assembly module TamB domain-containing protein [Desulfobotulus pelophilus]MCW7754892.1 translocation/assembly module TamB domain-containing protein [Desulfobotulus pelophilus]